MSLSLTTRLLEGVKRAYIWLRTDTRNSHVELGRGTRLNVGCEIRGPVELGNFCAIGRHVTFQGRNHVYTKPSAQVQFYRTYFDDELGYDAEGIRDAPSAAKLNGYGAGHAVDVDTDRPASDRHVSE